MSLDRVRASMQDQELDGLLVSQAENRRYLSGFTGSAGVLIIGAREQVLAVDSRYYEHVRQYCPDWQLAEVGYDYAGKLFDLLRELGLGTGRVGFESEHVSVAHHQALTEALNGRVELVPTSGVVESLRMVKTASEVVAIRRAVALADEVLAHITDWIEPGMSEQEVAWEIEAFMRTRGAEALSFPPTVAYGPRGAMPHARRSDQPIVAGEPIVIDVGCRIDGYCSDLTRTFCLGQPKSESYLAVWNVVRQANKAAAAGIVGGMSGKVADKLARDVVEVAGYAANFGHSLGHGVGLAVHEGPRVSYASDAPVPVGSVITIEPGIYLSGEFGVRLEDMALVTEGGLEVLTKAPKLAVVS
jgi:Xaa-Pro aminopeptidase